MANSTSGSIKPRSNALPADSRKMFVTSSGVSAGTDMALAVIAQLFGQPAAQDIADVTEYEWQTDSARDPFAKFLNQGKLAPELGA